VHRGLAGAAVELHGKVGEEQVGVVGGGHGFAIGDADSYAVCGWLFVDAFGGTFY
jgi:hypothetical protein